jgi:hypothetical protein
MFSSVAATKQAAGQANPGYPIRRWIAIRLTEKHEVLTMGLVDRGKGTLKTAWIPDG